MRNFKTAVLVSCLFLILNACSNDAANQEPSVTPFSQTGLLGRELALEIENVSAQHLQIFFDLEEAAISYATEDQIRVIVPRTLQTPTSVLKIIDLRSNETIFSEVFALKMPVISGYSANEATFGQTFSIFGENFDNISDDVAVTVNNLPATILSAAYNQVDILIPTGITNADLQIKVTAQRQEVVSPLSVRLKTPVISAIDNQTAWIRSQLVVSGENFNPNEQFGEVFINTIPCTFSVYNGKLSIDTPPGPYLDFAITNVTYKTAGQSVSFNTNIPIGNNAILVDHTTNIGWHHTIFEHNNKAYNLVALEQSSGNSVNYGLMEFSSTTEKWTQLSSFNYYGNIADAVYDGENSLYLYQYIANSDSFILTKLNMDNFTQETLTLPYNKIRNPILFAYQDHLYLLSGLEYSNGQLVARTEKYKYSEASNSWTMLSDATFSSLPLVSTHGSGKCNYMHYNNSIYISYGINFKTYRITPGLAITEYPYNFSFGYQNAVIGRYGNGTSETLYNIATQASVNMQDDFFDYGNEFFVVNNQIYFIRNSWTSYYSNRFYTQRLRQSILNGIL